MADPITLPPLPEPAFSLRWERGEYKVSPPMDDCDCYTADQMHAHAAAVSAYKDAEIAVQQDSNAAKADRIDRLGEMVVRLQERVRVLEDALREYANPLNWNEDSQGIRRVWLEPGSTTPAAYNGFEAASAVLGDKNG